MTAAPEPRWESRLEWANLDPRDRTAFVARIAEMLPGRDPEHYWRVMALKDRQAWVYNARHPVTEDPWQDEQERISRQADPDTRAAFDALEGPQCGPSPVVEDSNRSVHVHTRGVRLGPR